ncbi:hypothetical protein EVAR_51649_1 [Eumeta japonica]|uniref:Uncharacterized protein n=1 Tax=Eumeta variegata TaxID=151549 RepID=A0A4C1YGS2_EUMVA|nr:hypothetical protein EVAR_51649_1 [Eumeta japonica]
MTRVRHRPRVVRLPNPMTQPAGWRRVCVRAGARARRLRLRQLSPALSFEAALTQPVTCCLAPPRARLRSGIVNGRGEGAGRSARGGKATGRALVSPGSTNSNELLHDLRNYLSPRGVRRRARRSASARLRRFGFTGPTVRCGYARPAPARRPPHAGTRNTEPYHISASPLTVVRVSRNKQSTAKFETAEANKALCTNGYVKRNDSAGTFPVINLAVKRLLSYASYRVQKLSVTYSSLWIEGAPAAVRAPEAGEATPPRHVHATRIPGDVAFA